MIFSHVKADKSSFVGRGRQGHLAPARQLQEACDGRLRLSITDKFSAIDGGREAAGPGCCRGLPPISDSGVGGLTSARHWPNSTQRELADFGASTADVYRELATPFWRAPPPC